MESQPGTPPNPSTLAARLAAARRAVDPEQNSHDSADPVTESEAPDLESGHAATSDGADEGLSILESGEDEQVNDNSHQNHVTTLTPTQEGQVARHSLGAATARTKAGALGIATNLSKKLDAAAEDYFAPQDEDSDQSKRIPLSPSSDVKIVKHVILAGRADKNLDRKVWADRHDRLFGDADQAAAERKENGIMTRKERKKALRKITLRAALGRISIADARIQRSETLATPLDLGEAMRNHGMTTTQKLEERRDRAQDALDERRAKVRGIKDGVPMAENDEAVSPPPEQLNSVIADELLAEMYGLRFAGLSDHEIEDELTRNYPREDSEENRLKVDFVLSTLENTVTEDNPGWFEYSRYYQPNPDLSKKLHSLSRGEIKQISQGLPQLVTRNQETAEAALERPLTRQERSALSVRTRMEFVKQFSGEHVTWQDMDQFQTFLFQNQEAKLPPPRGRGGNDAKRGRDEKEGRTRTDYRAVAESLPEDVKQKLLDIDDEVADTIEERVSSWGTLTPEQRRAKNEEVRDEIYEKYPEVTVGRSHAETLAIIKALNSSI